MASEVYNGEGADDVPSTRNPHRRQPIPREVKARVWDFTWGHCWYCGTNYMNPFDTFVIEYVVPLCRGGTDAIENLVPSCCYCNQAKGTLLVEEWRAARPHGDDPDNYPFLREYSEGGAPFMSGLFWFERERTRYIVEHRLSEIANFRRLEREYRKGRE